MVSVPASARARHESGQAVVLLIGLASVLIAGALVLAAFGQGLGGKGRHQRAADLAAVSAAHAMRDAYPGLLEPAYLRLGVPNPRHLSRDEYADMARAAAIRAARRNGFKLLAEDIHFSGGDGLGPLLVRTVVRGEQELRLGGRNEDGAARRSVRVRGRAKAELVPLVTTDLTGAGGEYDGPFAYRQGEPMRPDVAQAFDRMEAAAREDGISLTITSAFRSDAEQARLFAQNPDPKMVARPGSSLHRYGTELDLGPASAYGWLARNAERFGFIQRYSWEPWHYGYTHNPGSSSVGFGRDGVHSGGSSAVPSFVPAQYRPAIVAAARRWKVSAALISAQIYAESNFNPRAVSPAGAQGIAQFMPGTAAAYGLGNPFDPEQAIDTQAHLMHDLLRRFASVPLALAAYNAGEGAVAACGCIPPYPETQAYVAKILSLIGAEGLAGALEFEVRLVE
jgi:hypothetical protein